MSPRRLHLWHRNKQTPDSSRESSTEISNRAHLFDFLRRHRTPDPSPARASSDERGGDPSRSRSLPRDEEPRPKPLRASPTGRESWLILKATLKTVCDGCDMFPPLKTALYGVVSIMELVDTVRDAHDEFAKLATRIKVLETVFSQYQTQSDVPPVIERRVERLLRDIGPIAGEIESKMKRPTITRIIAAPKDIEDVQESFEKLAAWVERFQLECNLNVEYRVEDMATENLLAKLRHVQGAGINGQSGDACMKDTRAAVLDSITVWSRDPDAARIFWLSGMAGIGKSAIARSVCLELRNAGILGASFFCSRGIRDDATRIIPTIAESLARTSQPYRQALLEVLRQNPDAGHGTVKLQVEYLLENPLREAFGDNSPTFVVAVDALDECLDPKATRFLLDTLASRSPYMPIKFFLTSRPEQYIQSRFSTARPDLQRIVRLHDIEQHIIESDIELYCSKKLQDIRREWSPSYTFPEDWPPWDEVATISKQAGKLFIYAFTAMQFIGEEHPVGRLQEMSRHGSEAGQPLTGPLDGMYSLVIDRAMNPKLRTRKEISQTRQIVAIILTLREALTVSALAELIGTTAQDVRAMLSRLHAVVYIPPDDEKGAVTTFHASFEDYLTTLGRAPDAFKIDLFEGHAALAQACIHMMGSDSLYFNVSGCHTSYVPNSQQDFESISSSIVYSCLHWVHHLLRVTNPSSLLSSVGSVLRRKILFWLEVLSASGNARLAMGLLHRVLTAENMRDRLSPEIVAFLRDAKDFVMLGHDAIELSAPHIYLSVLPSLSPSSTIAKTFWPKFRNVPTYDVTGIHRSRGPLLQMSGHAGEVYSVTFSPDGTRVVSGSWDEAVRIWDARTGDLLMDPLEGHRDKVFSVAFSPDGAVVVSGSLDGTIRLWNARTGELMMNSLEGHSDGVLCVAFSPDGAKIISGSMDHTLRLWDAKTGKPLLHAFEGHTGDVNTVMFSPDGRRVVSGSDDKTIRLWDVTTGEDVIAPLSGHSDRVRSVAFSPDGTRIVSGSSDDTIRLWDARTGAPIIDPLVGHTDAVFSVAFSPDGTRIVSGSADKTVRLWDAATGRPAMQPFEGHGDHVWSVGFSPDGSTVVSGSGDETIRLWSADVMAALPSTYAAPSDTVLHDGTTLQGSRLAVLDDDEHPAPDTNVKPQNTPSESPQGYSGRVLCVAFTPDGTQIVSGSEDKTVSLWNAQTGAPVLDPLQGHGKLVTCLAVSPDGSYIASGSADETIHFWDARTGRQVADPLSGHGNWVHSLVFSLDGMRIISGSSDGTIRIWDARTGRPVMEPLEGHSGTVWSVAISPDGTQIVSGSADNTLQLWDATTREQLMEPLHGHSHEIYSVGFSPDGARIVSGSADATVRLWNARTGDAVMEPLRGHTNPVLSISFSPDGEVIASGSIDATVRLWNATTGVPVMKPLEGHSDVVCSVAFSPDGTRLVSGSSDSTIRVWDVTPGDSWMGSQGAHGSTIWSAIASSMRLPALPRSAHSLNCDNTETAQSSSTSQIVSEELLDPSQFRLESGWIKGPQDKLIMWIPKDYWRAVLMPRTKVLIGRYRAILDVSRFAHGDRWTECYTPSMTLSNP
ncbi:hypothetical protein CERSUDRAFT_138149 [Gelatoporia subvermispora B]|uniref:NACHT domain-containing protein n=1 Tax=Ceriporiopsis subvermispora (strain B) TaxID=914234 RepID=M2QHH6_CERS8|nr:hypothetical protein CERSUDRAFT_138149 [Gelatoporia subvermispora B]